MLVKLAWRNIWRNKLRTSIMLGAMVFGLMSVIVMIGFMNSFYNNMIDNTINWQTSHVKIHDIRYPDDPDINFTIANMDVLSRLLDKQDNIKAWTSRHLVNGMIASARSTRGVVINGIDLKTEVVPLSTKVIAGEWMDDQGRNPIMVSKKTSERLNLRIGSKVVLTFSGGDGDVTGAAFRVRGIFQTASSSMDDSNVYVRKADLSKVSNVIGVHEVAIMFYEIDDAEIFVNTLPKHVNANTREQWLIRDWQTISPILKTMMDTSGVFNAVFLLIFVIAMAFGIVNILLMSVFERTQEFGVLMAVGMSKGNIRGVIILESALMSICGTTVGLLGAMGLTYSLSQTGIDLTSFGDSLQGFGVDTILYPSVSIGEYASAFSAVMLAILLSGLYPAHKILQQRPVDAMSEKH